MKIKDLFDLKGKTALVTGGSQGIGKAISLALAEYGANVIVVYRADTKLAQETEAEIKKLGVNSELIQSDISELESIKSIHGMLQKKAIEIDILVLNEIGRAHV